MPRGALAYREEVGSIPDPQEKQIRRFLLGEVVESFEDWTSDEVELVEEDLVDQYVRGELSPHEKAQFESHYLPLPGNRRKVQFASALQRHLGKPGRTWIRIGFASGLAASIAVAGMLFWRLATVTLYPGAVRDSGDTRQTIGRVIPRPVRLTLINLLPPGTFRLVLKGAQGVEIWSTFVQVEPSAQYLGISLPVRGIPPGEYAIELQSPSNNDSVASYLIRIN